MFAPVTIVEQAQHRAGDRGRLRVALDEFRNNLAIRQDVRHAEVFYANQQAPGQIGQRRHFIDEDEGQPEERRFQGRGPGGDHPDRAPLHRFCRLADHDLDLT